MHQLTLIFQTIFSALASHGRLSAFHIAQRCRLPLRHVYSGLIVLVHRRLVHHHTEPEGKTTYEANGSVAIDLLQIGRLIQTTHRRLGPECAHALKRLILLGHAVTADFEAYLEKMQLPELETQIQLRKVLQHLSDHQFITAICEIHFQSPLDVRRDLHAHIKSQESVIKLSGKKGEQILNANVDREITQRLSFQVPVIRGEQPSRGPKRPSTESSDQPASKRFKTGEGVRHGAVNSQANMSENEAAEHVSTFYIHYLDLLTRDQDQQIIQPNISRSANALRNFRLVSHATTMLGALTGQVLAAVLEQIQDKVSHWPNPSTTSEPVEDPGSYVKIDEDQLLLDVNARDYFTSETFSLAEHRLAYASGSQPDVTPLFTAMESRTNGHVNGNLGHFFHEAISPSHIEEQLELLSQPPCAFVRVHGGNSQWHVDLARCRRFLQDREISNYIRSRFGQIAVRIIHILSERGKVEERWLQELSLCSARDLRQSLARLESHGFVGLQEVPREPQRQPNRTLFLWFCDSEEVQKSLLEDLCKAISRLVQRMSRERRRIQTTLDKVERSDVKGKEEELLGADEFHALQQWRKREEWMWVEVDRLSSTVALLRDI